MTENPLTIFTKPSVLDAWHDSEYASETYIHINLSCHYNDFYMSYKPNVANVMFDENIFDFFKNLEAVVQRCSVKKVFLEI